MPQVSIREESYPFPAPVDLTLIADTDAEPAWRSLGIHRVEIAGQARAIREEDLLLNPFTVLKMLRPRSAAARPNVLVVMAMSGHHGVVLRDLVHGLLAEHDVAVLDWVNARFVPTSVGPFGFAENIASVVTALRCLGPGAHLVGICQGTIPAIAAAAALCQLEDAARPASLSLLGGPVDPEANMTRVATMLAMTSTRWQETHSLARVPDGFTGAGRLVYPAATQQQGLLTYLLRQMWRNTPIARKVFADDGLEPDRFPFLWLYTSVKDIPATAFTESIAAVYQDRAIWNGGLSFGTCRIRPQTVRSLPLMTVEAREDDITAPGQTRAAHALFDRLPDSSRRHLLLDEGDHFALFHGRQCRDIVVPSLAAFFAGAP